MRSTGRIVSLLVAVLFTQVVTAGWAAAADLVADRDDYSPGDTAYLMGSGFKPGEGVIVTLAATLEDQSFIDYAVGGVYADQEGSFTAIWLVPEEVAGATITATAIGDESTLAATVTFTDTPANTYSVSAESMTQPTNQVAFSVVVGGGGSAFPAPPVTGATAKGVTSDGVNFALTLTGPTGNGNGTYTGSFTAIMGRRYQWNSVDVIAHLGAHGRNLGGPLSVTAPNCPTVTTASCPAGATEGDTSLTVSATVASAPSGGFIDPGAPGSGAVTFTVVRNSDSVVMGTLSGVAVSTGATGSQLVTVSSLTPGSYTVAAAFTPAPVGPGAGAIRYSASSDGCGFDAAPLCQPVTMVNITSPFDGEIFISSNCIDVEVPVSATNDGTNPVLIYSLVGGGDQTSSTLTVPLGQHMLAVAADNECTGDPVVSDPVTIYVKADTTLSLNSLPGTYITGSCSRTVCAKLMTSCGNAIAEQVVGFEASTDGGATYFSLGSGTTDVEGVACATWNANLVPGSTVRYRASFSGSDSYFSSSAPSSASISVIYNFVGFGPPLPSDGAQAVRKYKNGCTIPVKFRLFDCNGQELCTNLGLLNGTQHKLLITKTTQNCPSGGQTLSAVASGESNQDGIVRFSGTCTNINDSSGGNWIYNLSTKNTGLSTNTVYRIDVALDDGTTHCAFFCVR